MARNPGSSADHPSSAPPFSGPAHPGPGSITRLVNRLGAGETASRDPRVPVLYEELRKHAAAALRKRGDARRICTTDLVHMAYLRLFGGAEVKWESRAHFYGSAARAMERILVEHARRKGNGPVMDVAGLDLPDGGSAAPAVAAGLDAAAVSIALAELEAQDRDLAELVRLRVFAGLTLDTISEVLGIPSRTLDREWALARAWLSRRMKG